MNIFRKVAWIRLSYQPNTKKWALSIVVQNRSRSSSCTVILPVLYNMELHYMNLSRPSRFAPPKRGQGSSDVTPPWSSSRLEFLNITIHQTKTLAKCLPPHPSPIRLFQQILPISPNSYLNSHRAAAHKLNRNLQIRRLPLLRCLLHQVSTTMHSLYPHGAFSQRKTTRRFSSRTRTI